MRDLSAKNSISFIKEEDFPSKKADSLMRKKKVFELVYFKGKTLIFYPEIFSQI